MDTKTSSYYSQNAGRLVGLYPLKNAGIGYGDDDEAVSCDDSDSSPLAPPMNHVFVDFENVHQVDLTLIGVKSVSFTLMVGAKQTKLDSDLVEKLMEHSASVRLVKLKSSGQNALDFALAYYLGRAVLADPTAYYHIVSKDGGFDPLIDHLRARHINVQRHANCAELTFTWPGKKLPVSEPIMEKPVVKKVPVKKVAAKKVATKVTAKKVAQKKVSDLTANEGYERVWDDFVKSSSSLPTRRKSLQSKIGHLIGKDANGVEVANVIKRLETAGMLVFAENDWPKYSF
ncbi:MAG: PIN domain-containing protein [Verrucomicrobia bacterium]|nr:PIN domain-containing protein [Verrucomicrobiota bacterium]